LRDALQDASPIGADLEVDLFGLEFHQRLAHLDALALLLHPAHDACFEHRLAKGGHNDWGHAADRS
jgi:hypothetical protein